jgi:hypothetical protein
VFHGLTYLPSQNLASLIPPKLECEFEVGFPDLDDVQLVLGLSFLKPGKEAACEECFCTFDLLLVATSLSLGHEVHRGCTQSWGTLSDGYHVDEVDFISRPGIISTLILTLMIEKEEGVIATL